MMTVNQMDSIMLTDKKIKTQIREYIPLSGYKPYLQNHQIDTMSYSLNGLNSPYGLKVIMSLIRRLID